MKIIITIALTSLSAFAAGMFFPWWSITIVSFLVALLANRSAGESFLSGFLGVFLLWGLMAWRISYANEQILAHRMAQVILQKDAPSLLILLTSLIGGLASGVAAWCGSSFRRLVKGD